VDAHGLPVRILITDDTTHDATKADALIDKLPAEYIFADKAYDGNAIRNKIVSQSAIAVIPSKSNRKHKISSLSFPL
jgi:transposase